jgi:large subunit ribosomal protein L17e
MVKYSVQKPAEGAASAKASGIRVHFKNTRETINAIRGYSLTKAQKYLKDVLAHKDAIPFRVHTGGIGRHAQAKKYGVSQCRWPQKSVKVVLDLLKNVQSNAEYQGLDTKTLTITHSLAQPAQKHRRRTYRAHGRINPYMACPTHLELIASSQDKSVAKAPVKWQPKKRAPRLRSGATGFQ